jgi:hypothetical protein
MHPTHPLDVSFTADTFSQPLIVATGIIRQGEFSRRHFLGGFSVAN